MPQVRAHAGGACTTDRRVLMPQRAWGSRVGRAALCAADRHGVQLDVSASQVHDRDLGAIRRATPDRRAVQTRHLACGSVELDLPEVHIS